jgi:hypothetical protein
MARGKPKQQFIFATHNANFPVLGDVETITACAAEDEAMAVETGTIDSKSCQEKIVKIMEGGPASDRAPKNHLSNLESRPISAPMRRSNTTPKLSAHMRTIRKTDTKPELAVRRLVHAMGYRYRLHRRDLPGTPDLVFAGQRKVIFVHGCFWHRHDCAAG